MIGVKQRLPMVTPSVFLLSRTANSYARSANIQDKRYMVTNIETTIAQMFAETLTTQASKIRARSKPISSNTSSE